MGNGSVPTDYSAMLGKWCWAIFSGGDFELIMDRHNFLFSGRLGGQGPGINIDLVPKEDGSLEALGNVSARISLNAEQLLLERRGTDCEWSGTALACRTPRAAAKLYFTCCALRVVPGGYHAGLMRFKPRPLSGSGTAVVEAELARSSCASDPLPSISCSSPMDMEVQRGSSFSDPTLPSPARMPRLYKSSRMKFARVLLQVSSGCSARQTHRCSSQRSAEVFDTTVCPTVRSPFSVVHDCRSAGEIDTFVLPTVKSPFSLVHDCRLPEKLDSEETFVL